MGLQARAELCKTHTKGARETRKTRRPLVGGGPQPPGRSRPVGGCGPPPPNGPRGRRPLVGGDRPHTGHHEKAPSVKERRETPQAKGTPTRYMQMHYLWVFFRLDPPIYRRRPYGVAPFCGCSRLTEIWNNSWKSTKLQGLQPRLRPASRRAEFP